MDRTIKPLELKSLLGNQNVKLIDVRRKGDFDAAACTLPDATWFDPANIDGWCDAMPKDQEVVLYCMRGGAVSNEVVDTLQAKGVKARFIEGGIQAWEEAGGKLVSK